LERPFNESRGDSLIIRRRGFFGYKKAQISEFTLLH
jgi:hypothetical protein